MKKCILSIAGIFCLFFLFLFYAYNANADGYLLAYWKLDETTAGSTVIDSSGNGFNGTPHNSPQPSTDVPSTITFSDPESLNFNGSQWVSIPDNPAFASSSATFSVWVKFTNMSAGDMDMIAKRSSGGGQVQWQFGYNAGGNQFKVSLANGGNSCCTDYHWSPSSSLTVNTWYNIAVAIDGTNHTLKWYQNGVLQQTDNITGTNLGTEISGTDLTLGASYDGTGEFLQGYLDDVRMYDTALDGTQISDIAAGDSGPGVSTPTPTPSPTPNPTATPTITTTPSATQTSSSAPSATATPVCSAQTPPGLPNLFQINATDTNATVYFSPVNNSVTNYYISYGYAPGDERFGTFTNQGSSTGVLSYTISSLAPNTTYYFTVRPQNSCMPGNWSNEMKITTAEKSSGIIRYYKDFVSQILFAFPQKTTVLGAAIKKSNKTTALSCSYIVQSGDSLWSIAQMKLGTGFDYTKIEKDNSLSSTLLNPGELLKVGC